MIRQAPLDRLRVRLAGRKPGPRPRIVLNIDPPRQVEYRMVLRRCQRCGAGS